jgi:hypothetical protein
MKFEFPLRKLKDMTWVGKLRYFMTNSAVEDENYFWWKI